MITIVYGPAGCGKTRNQERIARELMCDKVFDDRASSLSFASLLLYARDNAKAGLVLTNKTPEEMAHTLKARQVHYQLVPYSSFEFA